MAVCASVSGNARGREPVEERRVDSTHHKWCANGRGMRDEIIQYRSDLGVAKGDEHDATRCGLVQRRLQRAVESLTWRRDAVRGCGRWRGG